MLRHKPFDQISKFRTLGTAESRHF